MDNLDPAESTVHSAEQVDTRRNDSTEPWSPGITIGFSFIVLLTFFLVQSGVAVIFAVAAIVRNPDLSMDVLVLSLEQNGLLLSIATLASLPPCLGLIALFAHFKKSGSIWSYLGFNPVGFRRVCPWLGINFLAIVVVEALSFLLDRPTSEFMVNIYKTAASLPLLYAAICLAAPIFEEVFFRGFLFVGLQRSRIGNAGAILITSLAWTIIHVQYELFDLTFIFALGLLFGWARIKTGSLLVPILMHIFTNTLSLVGMAFS